jgi:hypothetical protein
VGIVISAVLIVLIVLVGWALLAFIYWGIAEFDREMLKPALLGAALITVAGTVMFGLLGLAMALS